MNSKKVATIYGINGPVIYLKGKTGFKMSEMVHVGPQRLVGEVISLDKDRTTVQVYEETSGLRPGETVEATGAAISVTLAPGILNNIFDGIERPLERIAESGGAFITRGVSVDALDRKKLWDTHIRWNLKYMPIRISNQRVAYCSKTSIQSLSPTGVVWASLHLNAMVM